MTKTWLRWTPAIAAAAVVAAVAITVPMSATASATLPTKTPAQVIALMQSNSVRAFSGTVDQTSDLGLPSLPTTGAGSDSSLAGTLGLITGSHTARIYVDGAQNARIQILDQLAERDVIRHGTDLWLYDSNGNTVEHGTVSAHANGVPTSGMPSKATRALTPPEIASMVLARLKPTSIVSVGTSVSVAGRSAYDLVLTPRASDTLLGSVSIAVDSVTGMPLAVTLMARGETTAAMRVGFDSLDLTTPSASLFTFTPPAGATVKQLATRPDAAGTKPTTKPVITGGGWDAVVTIPKQAGATSELTKLGASSEFSALTTVVPGGRLFHTSIVNILFTTDGRVLAGSVSAERLESVAAAQ